MIHTTLTTINYPVRINHIKGHQDDHTPYDRLSLHAQLNVDADHLANHYQKTQGYPQPRVTMFPTTKAQLNIKEATITYKYKQAIRHADSAPALLQYIQTRNRWTETTLRQVHWEAHSSAIARQTLPHAHTVKLIHDMLPTNKRVSQYSELRSSKCPCCPYPEETFQHILRCPTRQAARTTLLSQLQATLSKLCTRPILKQILLDGITQWLEHSTLDPNNCPYPFQQLVRQQNKIGWIQLFRGRFSREWARHQQEHLTDTKQLTKKRTGHLWTVNIITKLWTEWYTIWETRNAVVHGHNASTQQTIRREQAIQEITLIYSKREHYLPANREHLFTTLEEHIRGSTSKLVNWLNTFRALFRWSIKRAQEYAAADSHPITNFFPRLSRRDAVSS